MKPSAFYIFLLLLFININFSFGQLHPIEKRGERYLSESLEVQPGQEYSIKPDFSFTSVFVRCDDCTSFEAAAIIGAADTIHLKQDIHASLTSGIQSNLVMFSVEIDQFTLLAGELKAKLTIVYLNASGKTAVSSTHKKWESPVIGDDCDQPVSIDQKDWRAGLSAPAYSRSFSTVEHLIVHHSATANNLKDYTNVVRNIYLLHTEGNGWSDIGYNYLIAPDGTIYKGRDPGEGAQDNVIGAHFCGKNSNTMGICLLGEYGAVQPSEAMMQALAHLLTWKATKEALDPLAFSSHADNASLGVIAGHRDGCSTACPGENVYIQLTNLRQQVSDLKRDCGTEAEEEMFVVRPNPTTDVFNVPVTDFAAFQWECYNMQGKAVKLDFVTIADNEVSFSVKHLPAGVYIAKFQESGQVYQKKIIVL